MISQKLENRARRWRTAWHFQTFLMTTNLFLLIRDILYIPCLHSVLAVQKNCYSTKKKNSHKVMLHTKIVWVTKRCVAETKKCYTQKRDSCWLNMFSVAQKENTCWQKKLAPVVYKYMLYWLKKFCVARKILWCRTKIKGEHQKFSKNCQVTSYAIIFGQRTFFSIIKFVFREKREFYFILLWCYFQRSHII